MPIELEQVNNIKTLFGNRIRRLRKARSITQEDLAYILKTDTRQIGRIENGEAFVNLKTVTKLANALDVPVKELFDFDEWSDYFLSATLQFRPETGLSLQLELKVAEDWSFNDPQANYKPATFWAFRWKLEPGQDV